MSLPPCTFGSIDATRTFYPIARYGAPHSIPSCISWNRTKLETSFNKKVLDLNVENSSQIWQKGFDVHVIGFSDVARYCKNEVYVYIVTRQWTGHKGSCDQLNSTENGAFCLGGGGDRLFLILLVIKGENVTTIQHSHQTRWNKSRRKSYKAQDIFNGKCPLMQPLIKDRHISIGLCFVNFSKYC